MYLKPRKGAHDESRLASNDRKTSQGYVDIRNLTIEQLDELIMRQTNLLQNKYFLQKLPDGGKKIVFFKTELETERKKKQEEYDEACKLLSDLSLNDINAEEMEWNAGSSNTYKKQLDSDDDDDNDDSDSGEEESDENEGRKNKINPLKLFATHSGTANGKNIKILSENKVCDKSTKDVVKLIYVDKFCEKYGQINSCKERFKPNQFKNNDRTLFVTSAEHVKNRLGNKWEVTQVTPPVPTYQNAVMISLSESLKLQKQQVKKLKEIEEKLAREKLLKNMPLKMGNKLPVTNIMEYRSSKNLFEESIEDDENEFNNSDCEDEKNTVGFFTDDN